MTLSRGGLWPQTRKSPGLSLIIVLLMVLAACLLAAVSPPGAAASPDGYEPDNTTPDAAWITPDASIQSHTFDPSGDVDWLKFDAVEGTAYEIETLNLGPANDTVLELYDVDGVTMLLDNDDCSGGLDSCIGWLAPASGVYYLRVAGYDAAAIGDYDIRISPGGILTGTVTSDVTTLAAEGVNVNIYYASNQVLLSTVTTDAAGDWEAGVPAGNFKVEFNDPQGRFLKEFYDGRTTIGAADAVTATADVTTSGLNAGLADAGRIEGRVTGVSADGVGGIWARVWNAGTDQWVTDALTDATGDYSAGGLPPGNYKVQFYQSAGNYVPEFYNDKPLYASADAVVVASGGTTPNIDAQIVRKGRVGGTVTGATGTPLAGAGVEATLVNGIVISSTVTGPDGSYEIEGLSTNSYKIKFTDLSGTHLPEYYNDQPVAASADVIAVTNDALTSGIDAQLAYAGKISGRITNSTGDGISGISIETVKVGTGTVRVGTSGAGGNYTVNGLGTGDYTVLFRDDGSAAYAYEYWNDQTSIASADVVSVTAGNETVSIDAELALMAGISGRVTNQSGSPLDWMDVNIFDADTGIWVDGALTDISGNYSRRGLSPGRYRVGFSSWDGSYLTEFYNNKSSSPDADVIEVTAQAMTEGVDAVLSLAGTMSGTFTIASSTAVTNDPGLTLDSDVTGAAEMRFSNDGVFDDTADSEAWRPYASSQAWTLTTGDGTKNVYAEFKDGGGQTMDLEDSIILDTTGPSSLVVEPKSHDVGARSNKNQIIVNLGATDDTTSVDGYSYSWTTTADAVSDTTKDAQGDVSSVTSDILSDGSWYFHARAVDSAGNWSAAVDLGPFIVDTVKPVTSLGIVLQNPNGRNGWYRNVPVVTLTKNEAGTTFYQWDSTAEATWGVYTAAITAPQGSHKLYYKSKDTAGNGELVRSYAMKTDSKKPASTFSAPSYSTAASKSRYFKLIWGGKDPAPSSGVGSYDVNYRLGGTTTWKVWRKGTTATSAFFPGSPGKTYYFGARAHDRAGNPGPWVYKKTVVPLNEGVLKYSSGWGGVWNTSSALYMSSAKRTKQKNASASYTFKGASVVLIATKGKNKGKAAVYIDGKYKKTIDLYSSTTKYRQAVWISGFGSVSTSHTVRFVNLATSGRPWLEVDGIAISR